MKQYNIDILALSEIRWKGVGQETLDHGYVLLYSGEENHHQTGVGLMMCPAAYRTMLKWTPINERILFARLATTYTKFSVIVCYAPTNETDDDVKDSFYENLQAVTKDIPKHDVLCVVVMTLSLVGHSSSIKNVHKYTWTSPDGSTRNQIDHFLIARRWRTSLLDVRGYRGADAQSHHILMIAHIQIKLRAQKKTQQDLKKLYERTSYRIEKIRRDFCISLWNKFDALAVEANDSESVEEKWEKIKSTYTMIAEEKLGFRKKPKESWDL
ncbi:hypothetical protein QYM36_005546 [Artemia franciscana]|uniref:Uncharacterized protein n=1 Tax=Artemia franciscana TaxID=6661 RepID=A0AA88L9U2_ARTSF|nr:hypothetical protein QYM36_005546 [Artemia franciscana]